MRDLPMTPAEWQAAEEFWASVLGKGHDHIGCADCGVHIGPTNAGRWSALWCDNCDEKRVGRVGKSLDNIATVQT